MLIALDARTVYQPIRRGTGKNLIDLYTQLARIQPSWRVNAYHRNPSAVLTSDLLPREQVTPRFIEIPGDRFDAWGRLRLGLAAWRDKADLLHCPANVCPRWMPIPTLVSIHDLIPLDHPQGRRPADVQRFAQSIRHAASHAAGIICPSHYTRNRLIHEFNADPARITVNPWAADSNIQWLDPQQCRNVLEHYGASQTRYVIHLGASAPRKNTHRVIEAWSALDTNDRNDWKLLIIGLDDVTRKSVDQMIHTHGLTDSVIALGFADEAHLPALFSGADILAFPSLSEGFGLPILDAWATRCAVLTSNCTSLPEVAQDAALLIDPTCTADIAAGLSILMRDEALRQKLVTLGTQRLKTFTWQATADRFIHAIHQALRMESQNLAA